MTRYCLAVDLVNDPKSIAAYDEYHKNVWPEILTSIADSGIVQMEIYRFENRLFMIMETEPSFSFAQKAAMDAANPAVQRWEELMGVYQRAIPGAATGEKWSKMERVFTTFTNSN